MRQPSGMNSIIGCFCVFSFIKELLYFLKAVGPYSRVVVILKTCVSVSSTSLNSGISSKLSFAARAMVMTVYVDYVWL